ncbi:MAG: hypothetical protein RI993_1638 [Pseudomonadota bacterium]|jgi:REP element-mobilizing transposase RayT
MARLPRIVIPGYPHHVTQRGNRRAPTFFEDDDYELYVALPWAIMKRFTKGLGVDKSPGDQSGQKPA